MNRVADLQVSPPLVRKPGAAERYRAETAPRARAMLKALGRVNDAQDSRSPRMVAEALSSQLFFGPLLEEMRKSPFGQGFGSGGRGEEVFGEQLDNQLADAVASRTAGGFVEKIAKELAARQQATEKARAGGDSAKKPATANPAEASREAADDALLGALKPSISTFSLRSKELP